MLPAAMKFGVTPIEAKEIVYPAVDYRGIGRGFPFLKATNAVLMTQDGCEPQLISHAAANMRIGNDKAFLIKLISQCISRTSGIPAARTRCGV